MCNNYFKAEEFFENKKINTIFVRKLILEKKNNKEFSGYYFSFEDIGIQCKVVEGFNLKTQQIEVPFMNHNIFSISRRFIWEDLKIKISIKDYNDFYESLMLIRDFSIEKFSNDGFLFQKWNVNGFLTNSSITSIKNSYEIYLTFTINYATLTI
jgi:hypothetical protein